jgi:hypothetical protein
MPNTRRRTDRLVSVTTKVTVADFAKLAARAALQRISHAEVLRQLIAALPVPTPRQPRPRRGDDVA